jgi:serine/threonine-protein kinase
VVARPGESEPTPLAIPEVGAVAEDELLVSAGWLDAGDDDVTGRAGRVWVESFVIQRDPVTFRALMPFLASDAGAPFRAGVLRDGLSIFQPDWPAIGVSWECATAFASWWSERTGERWRLAHELEWEKAARGADGRTFPWGDAREPSFAHVRDGGRTPTRPEPVDASIDDVSPYGVRGMAGNVREWCADDAGGRRIARGGSYRLPLDAARTTSRSTLPADRGFVDVGLRLVRPL